jgi:hypothetical protein
MTYEMQAGDTAVCENCDEPIYVEVNLDGTLEWWGQIIWTAYCANKPEPDHVKVEHSPRVGTTRKG